MITQLNVENNYDVVYQFRDQIALSIVKSTGNFIKILSRSGSVMFSWIKSVFALIILLTSVLSLSVFAPGLPVNISVIIWSKYEFSLRVWSVNWRGEHHTGEKVVNLKWKSGRKRGPVRSRKLRYNKATNKEVF